MAMAMAMAMASLSGAYLECCSSTTTTTPAVPLSPCRCLFKHPIPSSQPRLGNVFFMKFARESRRLKASLQTSRRSRTRSEARDSSGTDEKAPFGYTRKDVILIGLGLTVFGVGLKYGLEFVGVDPLKAGNVVQLVMVLGLTVGWISTYVFRVSTKEMTYAKQLKEYENKVMQKRLEELPEAELESLLAQVEEDKRQLQQSRDQMSQ